MSSEFRKARAFATEDGQTVTLSREVPKMRVKTLGLILLVIGLVGAVIAFGSGLIFNTTAYNKMGLVALLIEFIGLAFIFIDKD